MSVLPMHEHGIYFHLFVSSSISFLRALYFSEYRSFTSLVKFISTYFISLVAIVNGISFLVSFSDSSLFGVQKCHQFLNIDFVSHYFAEFTVWSVVFWWTL